MELSLRMLSRLRCTVLSARLSCFTARALRHSTAGGAEVPRAHEAQGFGDVARDARQLHRAQGHILTTSPLGVSYKQQLSGLHEGFILLRYHILYIMSYYIAYMLYLYLFILNVMFLLFLFSMDVFMKDGNLTRGFLDCGRKASARRSRISGEIRRRRSRRST